jgi:RHS repeat-associated protein
MHRLITLRILAMVISCVITGPLLLAAAPDQQTYVVTLRPDASIDGIRVVARQLAASYGGTVMDGEGGGEDTFAIRLPQSRAHVLAADPHVKSVAPMRLRPEPQAVVETVNWSSGVSYTYDGSGNISQIGNDAFVYDGVSRLVKATVNGVNRTYQYDAYGNRTACTQLGPNDCQGFSINTAENKNRIAGAGYDPAGNVTSLSGHVYSYDPLNMMTRDSFGQLAREFVYTADDERIATYNVGSSWSWTVRGTDGKVLREFASNDGPAGPGTSSWRWTQDNVWRNGLLLASRQPDGSNTTTYHYHLDHLGTPRRVTDQNDRTVGVHDYLAYGPELSTSTTEPSATALKYTGHERDSWSTGSSDTLDYMHARYYSPWLGRFMSVDPGTFHPENPQSWNRYAYSNNNPLTLLDPNGRQAAVASMQLQIREEVRQLHSGQMTRQEFDRRQDLRLNIMMTGLSVIGVGEAVSGLRTAFALARAGLSAGERGVVMESAAILKEGGKKLFAIFESGEAKEVTIAGQKILVQPDLPVSGMTLHGENMFVLGKDAFASNSELAKTILQEMFRLAFQEGTEASVVSAPATTKAAFDFAAMAENIMRLCGGGL